LSLDDWQDMSAKLTEFDFGFEGLGQGEMFMGKLIINRILVLVFEDHER
jgi:hypothetical protein